MYSFPASYVAIWALVIFQGLLIIALLRELAEIRRLVGRGVPKNDELAVGTLAPEFASTEGRSGLKLDTHSLIERGGVMLFLSPDCSICLALVDEMQESQIQNLPPIFVWCDGGLRACAGIAKHLTAGVHFFVDGAKDTAARYHVSGFPTAVVVDRKRIVRGYGHPKDFEDLKRLIFSSLDSEAAVAEVDKELRSAAFNSGVVQ